MKKLQILFILITFVKGICYAPKITDEQVGKNTGDGIVLVHHFNADIDSTIYDVGGNGNNGAITGASWIDGLWGSCLDFDTNDYVVIQDNATIDIFGPSQVCSITFWVKLPFQSGAGAYPLISKSNKSGTRGLELSYNKDLDQYVFQIYNGSDLQQIKSQTGLDDNEWHFFVWIRNSVMKIYVDGELIPEDGVTSGNGFNADYNNNEVLRYNGYADNTSLLDFLIEEVVFYKDIELSAAEILHIYQRQITARQ